MTNPMSRRSALTAPGLLAVAAVPARAQPPGGAADADWRRSIASVLGRPGTEMPGGVYRVALPRTDLRVTLDGIAIRPGFGLGSWIAFHAHDQALLAMGDLVLLEREIAPVMRRLAEGGIAVTALHNHLLRAAPATMYLHIAGRGDAARLATALRAALQESATPLEGAAAPAGAPGIEGVDAEAFARALGQQGSAAGGVYAVTLPRAETIREHGAALPPALGLGTAINLQAAGDGRGAVTGDFVLTGQEVMPVQRALLENGIEVTAIHNHMLEEEPRLFFLHFWGVDAPERLGRGLRAAIARTNSRRAQSG